jgi:inosine-uridine nucleoside N-ribohydrolase
MKLKLVLLFSMAIYSSTTFAQRQAPTVNVIFDTDIGPDYDDVGAIALLHALADDGKAKILATVASNKYEGIAAVLNVFNTYFKRPGIPIGVPRGDAVDERDGQHWSDTILAKYPHKIKTNAEVDDATAVYRKVLAAQPDNSVTIVTVGFLTNIFNLMNSKADVHSPLDGKRLIAKKVKLMVSMAGKFPTGKEFNVLKDVAASNEVFQNIGIPVIYSGYEIGEKIKTGLPLVNNNTIKNSPVKDVFRIAMPQSPTDKDGRMSWDQTAVLVAINGCAPYYELHKGKMSIVTADGRNSWNDEGMGQAYLVEKMDYKAVQDVINKLMIHQPKSKEGKL